MGKQTFEEKEALIELMGDLRARTKKKAPQLEEDLQKLGYTNFTINILRNDFFGHPERSSTYDSELVIKIIEAYYHYIDGSQSNQTLIPINLLEAVLVLNWTHTSLPMYLRLIEIFECTQDEVVKVMQYVMECEKNDIKWISHSRIMVDYLPSYLEGSPARPWDGVSKNTTTVSTPHIPQVSLNLINGLVYEQLEWARNQVNTGQGYDAETALNQIMAETFRSNRLILWSEAAHLLGRIQMQQGKYREAETIFNDALNKAPFALKKQIEANLGASLYYRGEYRAAVSSLLNLKNRLSPENDAPIYVFTLNFLGAIAGETWNLNSAKQYYHEALTLSTKLENSLRTAFLYMALGNVYRYESKFLESGKAYQAALQTANQINHPTLHAELLWQQSITQAATNQLDKAEIATHQSLELAGHYCISEIMVCASIEQARLNFRRENYSQAYEKLSETYHNARTLRNVDLVARTLYALITTSVMRFCGLTTGIDSDIKARHFMRTHLPSDIFEDASQINFNTLQIRRAQTYFWNGIPYAPSPDPLNITSILFRWLKPINEAPPRIHPGG